MSKKITSFNGKRYFLKEREKRGIALFYFFFFLFLGLGFALAKQVLYHLSHTSSPFCSGYFGDKVL
jgi:hypothetical protein